MSLLIYKVTFAGKGASTQEPQAQTEFFRLLRQMHRNVMLDDQVDKRDQGGEASEGYRKCINEAKRGRHYPGR